VAGSGLARGRKQIGSLVAVTGVVQDQTGAVLSGASVDLLNATGVAVQSAFTDGVGTFRFEQVAAGQYQIRAQYEGFTPASTRVRVTARAPGAQKLVLGIAGLTQEITVSNAVGISDFPANDYDLSSEWGRADFDRRHRIVVLGRVTAVTWVDLGVGLTMNSAAAYNETLGGDPYNNGRGRARPTGVQRNSLRAAESSSLDY
jgi:hypothetical protein